MEEVVISRKLNRWGNRFGFVHFCNVKNVSRLESKLDSIHIIGKSKAKNQFPMYPSQPRF